MWGEAEGEEEGDSTAAMMNASRTTVGMDFDICNA